MAPPASSRGTAVRADDRWDGRARPPLPAGRALWGPHDQPVVSALDAEGLPFHQCARQFRTGGRQYPLKRALGKVHASGAGVLIEILNVLEPQGFELVHRQTYFLKLGQRHTCRFEVGHAG